MCFHLSRDNCKFTHDQIEKEINGYYIDLMNQIKKRSYQPICYIFNKIPKILFYEKIPIDVYPVNPDITELKENFYYEARIIEGINPWTRNITVQLL